MRSPKVTSVRSPKVTSVRSPKVTSVRSPKVTIVHYPKGHLETHTQGMHQYRPSDQSAAQCTISLPDPPEAYAQHMAHMYVHCASDPKASPQLPQCIHYEILENVTVLGEQSGVLHRRFYIIVPIHRAGREDRPLSSERKEHTYLYVGDGASLT